MPGRDIKSRLTELTAVLKNEPESLDKRLELAALLQEAGQPSAAIELSRGVATAYAERGQLVKAMAVCRGILDFDPEHRETLELLAALATRKGARAEAERTVKEPPKGDEEASSDAPSAERSPITARVPPAAQDEEVVRPKETKRPLGDGGDEPPKLATASSVDQGEILDREGERLLHELLDDPFPRPQLTVEPPPFPLLSALPRSAFMELLTRLSVVRLEAGEAVLREGEAGDACYLLAAGRVRVTKEDVAVAELGPGAFFGEFAVLADQRRHASVEALEPVELLEIRRALLDELIAAHPGVARTLRTFYRERLLATLMATSPFFQSLSAEERIDVAERFRPRRFGRGAQIVEEGAPGGGLYLILVGEVEVVRAGDDSQPVRLAKLGEGSYFGEMSLLRGGVAEATVRALRLTEAVQLPPRDFYEIASRHPVLWQQLHGEPEERELANHAIVAGEARKSETFYLV